MKLLVTGAAGFIGSNFVHYWLREHPQDQIVSLDALTYAGNLANLKATQPTSNHTFIKGDITNAKDVELAMQGCNTVVHFAAETHVDRSVSGPGVFVSTNINGTFTLLEQARIQNIKRFHHISTDEVFGSLQLDSDAKFNEETAYDPSSPYSASKASSDMLVRAYHRTYKLPITISNCSNNYGPYQFPEKLIPLMILNAIENKKLPMYGKGTNIRDWIYVEDHVRAIDSILHHGVVGETYCVGGESERTNVTIVQQILSLLHKPESLIEYVADRPGHDARYAIDNSKIRNELGFTPHYSLEEGLAQTVSWYQDNLEWCKKVRSGEYQNYYNAQYGQL